MRVAIEYAEKIVSKKLIAGQMTRLAAERFLRELDKPEDGFEYSEELAAHICRFLEKMPHVKGSFWRNKTIELEPWQVFWLANLNGWRWKEDGTRRFATAYLEVARKNSKTTMAAGAFAFIFLWRMGRCRLRF